ncbi:class F sortase [Streptomyces pilosus]|uniref:class F sortase n=1 Tax=Streptomyces pilosus TaxID=28893 RepID=UPI0036291225
MGSVGDTLRAHGEGRDRLPSGTGRLFAGVVWLVLLLGLWLWGGGGPDGLPAGSSAGPATGDMAAAGRPDRGAAAVPRRLDVPGLGLRAPVVAGAFDARGVPRPAGRAGAVAWYADGTAPGTAGLALLAGPAGAGGRITVGQEVRVVRADGAAVGYTVGEVRSGSDDVRRVAAERHDGLRLIVCAATAGGRTDGGCASPVVVLAHPARR